MRTSFLLASVLATTSLVGCMDSADDELAAEEAAEAGASGKADEAGFQFAHLTAFNIDYEDKEPVIAIFHKPDANTPAGESGLYDLVLFRDSYESDHLKGSFKLYEYRGRNRIRFSDEQGRVKLRSDWHIDEDDDFVLGEEVLLPSTPPAENPANCLVVEVHDDNVFEEGLTVYEYPDVSIDKEGTKFALSIGGHGYSEDDEGTTVTVTNTATKVEGIAKTEWGQVRITVPNKAPRRGAIYQTEGDEDENHVADIVCR